MAPTNVIKFCGFRMHTKPNNMTLLAFPEKSLKLKKKKNVCVCVNVADRRA